MVRLFNLGATWSGLDNFILTRISIFAKRDLRKLMSELQGHYAITETRQQPIVPHNFMKFLKPSRR